MQQERREVIIAERRSQKRITIDLPVIYTYSGKHKIAGKDGTTFDLSDSGMCFYTDKLLRKGLNLQIQLLHIWEVPRLGIVRWYSMKKPNYYKVGVFFR